MTPEPIYDDSVPIACTASREVIPLRLEAVERMRSNLVSVERTEHGVLLRFPSDEATLAEVRQFAAEEKDCCRFWGFEVQDTPEAIALRWDGPPAVAALFDELVGFFESDEPLTAFSGLLL